MMDRTYRLKYPVTLNFQAANGGGNPQNEVIEEITLRRATAKDLLAVEQFNGQDTRFTIEMIQRLSGLEKYAVERLDAYDIGPLAAIAMSYALNGPATGETA